MKANRTNKCNNYTPSSSDAVSEEKGEGGGAPPPASRQKISSRLVEILIQAGRM